MGGFLARAAQALVGLCLLSGAFPSGASAEPLTGQSACAFVEGLPSTGHPIRRFPPLRAAFALAAKADRAEGRHVRVIDAFDKALAPAWKEASEAFERPPKGDDGARATYRPERARAFLEKWVFSPTAPLRVGDEGFEMRTELAATIVQSQCYANRRDAAIATARRLTGPEGAPLRHVAALLLLEASRPEEAGELVGGDDRGFLALYVRAELATAVDERRRLHKDALSFAVTPDQLLALDMQARRLE